MICVVESSISLFMSFNDMCVMYYRSTYDKLTTFSIAELK